MNLGAQLARVVQIFMQRFFGFAGKLALLHVDRQQSGRGSARVARAPLSSMARALLRGVMQTRMRSCVPQLW